MLGVEPQWVHGLPDDVSFEMPNTGGVTVTPIEANHCPGSSLFLFEGPQTVHAGDSTIRSPFVGSKRVFRYLHCGDFRACPKHVLHPAVARARIDVCYLDTTYLNPKYCFPPQPLVIAACATLARKTVVGISPTAPALEELKPEIKTWVTQSNSSDVDIKPIIDESTPEILPGAYDPHGAAVLNAEKSKAMLQGWLVKKDTEDTKVGIVDEKPKGRTLVVMGTYSIGKERIVKGKFPACLTYSTMLTKQPLLKHSEPQYTVIRERRALFSAKLIRSCTH
jgi:DNA cross-link repair 1A protein